MTGEAWATLGALGASGLAMVGTVVSARISAGARAAAEDAARLSAPTGNGFAADVRGSLAEIRHEVGELRREAAEDRKTLAIHLGDHVRSGLREARRG